MTAEVSTAGASPGRNDAAITDLVGRARNGDKRAWDALVGRYAPLIWSICRRYQLRGAYAEDVGQSVWLHLVDQLDRVRDPAALPGWLATTARRECVRVLRAAGGPHDAGPVPNAENTRQKGRDGDEELLAAERHAALHEALMGLPPCYQQLIALLIEDPPFPYLRDSSRLRHPGARRGPSRRLPGRTPS